MDPELRKQLDSIRGMVQRSHQSPTKEWPLVFVEEFDTLLVVREWEGGGLTAYATSDYSDAIRKTR